VAERFPMMDRGSCRAEVYSACRADEKVFVPRRRKACSEKGAYIAFSVLDRRRRKAFSLYFRPKDFVLVLSFQAYIEAFSEFFSEFSVSRERRKERRCLSSQMNL